MTTTKILRNVVNAAALMYAREIDPRARLVDEGVPFTRFPVKPYAEIAATPAQGPVCDFVEVPIVFPSKRRGAVRGIRFFKINPDNLSLLGVWT